MSSGFFPASTHGKHNRRFPTHLNSRIEAAARRCSMGLNGNRPSHRSQMSMGRSRGALNETPGMPDVRRDTTTATSTPPGSNARTQGSVTHPTARTRCRTGSSTPMHGRCREMGRAPSCRPPQSSCRSDFRSYLPPTFRSQVQPHISLRIDVWLLHPHHFGVITRCPRIQRRVRRVCDRPRPMNRADHTDVALTSWRVPLHHSTPTCDCCVYTTTSGALAPTNFWT